MIKKSTASLIAILFIFCLAGCNNTPRNDVSGASAVQSSGQIITFKGLEAEIKLTVNDIKALPVIEMEAATRDSKDRPRTNQVKGTLLNEVLKSHGKTQAEFSAITASADDGYQVSIPNSVLTSRQVIIAYEMDGYEIPLRLCVPDERTMYWVKNLEVLEFSSGQQPEQCKKVILLETAVQSVEKVDFKYNANMDKAVKVSDLAAKYLKQSNGFVYVKAKDGLSPTSTYEVFLGNLIKIDGDAAPLLGTSDAIGVMSVKRFKSAQCGDTALFFAGNGTTVKAILEELSIPVEGEFVLTGEGGNTVTITAAQTASAELSISGDGTAEANGIKKLISIEVAS